MVPNKQMPLRGMPLSAQQIETIKKWIDQGAIEDSQSHSIERILLEHVILLRPHEVGQYLLPYEGVRCRLPVQSYATLIVRDEASGKELTRRGGAVQYGRGPYEIADMGAAGSAHQPVGWSLNQEFVTSWAKWPAVVSVELQVEYNDGPLWGMEFDVDYVPDYYYRPAPARSVFIKNPVSLSHDRSGTFHYYLQGDADVDIEIVRMENQATPIFRDHKADLKAGLKVYPWNLKDQSGTPVAPGAYVARFRATTRNRTIPVGDICLWVQVRP